MTGSDESPFDFAQDDIQLAFYVLMAFHNKT